MSNIENTINETNLNEGLGSNEPISVKSNTEPGLFNQAVSTVTGAVKRATGMNPENSLANKFGELRNQATSIIANQTGKAGNQVKNVTGKAMNAYGQARNQAMNRVGNVQKRGQNIISQARNTAAATAKTVQNTATATLATATNQAKKRVENLKELHSNATGTTQVIKAIKKNGRKTRKHIDHHMNRLANKVETSCGRVKNNAITVGGKHKSRKAKGKGKGNKRMIKRKSKRNYKRKARRTTKRKSRC